MKSFRVTSPTRVDLAGGTLDIWPIYCLSGGAKTINVALDLYATATFEAKPQDRWDIQITMGRETPVRLTKLPDEAEARTLPEAYRFPAFVIGRFLAQSHEREPHQLSVQINTSAPPRSGLGGSSTLCVAIVRGLSRLYHDYLEQGWQLRMLSWVRDAEAQWIRMLTGNQDYLAALFGGVSCFRSDAGTIERDDYSPAVLEGLDERLLVLFSGEHHHSGASNWEIIKGAMEGNDDVRRGIAAIGNIADQLDGELSSGTLSWKHIGALLSDEWEVRKRLFRVHTPRLDEIIEFLGKRDVLGAKVCGAAAGGSLIALVDPARRAVLVDECRRNGIEVLATRPAKHGVSVG